MTTVGYGDIAPRSFLGQTLAAVIMICGYGIIAVPTGIFSAQLMKVSASQGGPVSTQACPNCSAEGHAPDAVFCKFCGARL
jgi:voltage-gated potassium channel